VPGEVAGADAEAPVRPTLSFISRAALLVKVTARISEGQASLV
jgi:hypothetical protein